MLKEAKKLSVALLIVGMACGSAFAADYQSMTTGELAAIRGTIQNEPSKTDRAAFKSEWQKRVKSMTPDERAQYIGKPEGVTADAGMAQKSTEKLDDMMKGVDKDK
ncbi:MAG TPA: hypothetical protein ENK33_01995 [Desulfobacterales bacterium]|nr:hypothetical protein [Desulfobacterales bacterium]